MNNKTTTESATKIGEQQNGSYLQLLLYREAEKNNGTIAKNLKQFVPWVKQHEARVEYYYQLGKTNTQGVIDSAKESGKDFLDSIAKTLSTAKDDEEEVWMDEQYFRAYKHCEDVYAKMMQDKSIEPLGNEFFGLVAQGKRLITGGFSPLRE